VNSQVVRRARSRADHTADIRTEQRDGQSYNRQVLRAETAECFSARKLSDREDYPFATRKRRKSQTLRSLVGLSKKIDIWIDEIYQQDGSSSEPQILEILTVCQIIASFLIVIVSLLKLSLSDRDKALWSTLVGMGFGYLVPNPRFKRVASGGGGSDEPIHYLAAQQQLNGPLPGQQGVAMEDETVNSLNWKTSWKWDYWRCRFRVKYTTLTAIVSTLPWEARACWVTEPTIPYTR